MFLYFFYSLRIINNRYSIIFRYFFLLVCSYNYNINNYNYQCSSWSVENGAYLRLKNLTLGYTLPASWLAKTNAISKLRIYFTGADLWEHSKLRDGWDPEASRKTKDLGRYPFNRTFTVGVNATF